LPKPILIRLVGGDTRAMVLLAAGILLGIAAAGLALLALGAKNAVRATWAQVAVLLLTLATMVLLRDQVRQGVLQTAGLEPPSWVAPQWGPFAVFAVLLVAAIATIAWMATALAGGTRRPAG
jgi:ribose/xylose/arabinose/galactoside ABC-type transport system permease subunit